MRNTSLDIDRIEAMYYENQMSLREIGKIFEYSPSQIGRTLKKANPERYQSEMLSNELLPIQTTN